LGPGTPMLFQGQEFAAASPFCFFADHETGLARLVRQGRANFLAQFPSLAQPGMSHVFPDPGDPDTFARCKLDLGERQSHAAIYQMHKDLMRLRREDPVFRAQTPRGVDGAVLSAEALVLRFFGGAAAGAAGIESGDHRLLLVNLGVDLQLDPAPEPLLAPPEGKLWDLLWSSEDPRYEGTGTPPVDSDGNWRVPGHSAVVMRPVEAQSVWQI
jgi:maltooligosyltrehalose trehalohydrolase